MLKFRLSTILLLVALVATALGWYVDRNSKGGINGSWTLANFPIGHQGYSSTLEIRPDGTFSKIQRHRRGEESFAGTYNIVEPGIVDFRVSKADYTPVFDVKGAFPDLLDPEDRDKTPETKIDRTFKCRYAIDSSGCLILHEYKMLRIFEEGMNGKTNLDIEWEIYAPANADNK